MSDELVQTLLGLLTAMLAASTPLLVGYFVKWLAKRLKREGLEATDRELELIRKLVTDAVAFAKKAADGKAKNGGGKMASPEKKELAMAFICKFATKYGLEESAVEGVEDFIESVLGQEPEL